MKLCRFELASAPGQARTGIYHSGRIYETQGINPVAQHEFTDIVLLTPTGPAPSYRLFQIDRSLGEWEGGPSSPFFTYLNPATVIAPTREFVKPLYTDRLSFMPQLAAVIANPGRSIAAHEADGYILGLCIANTFVARDVLDEEMRHGAGTGRSHDVATALGPVLTTPEELDEAVVDEQEGRRYRFVVTVRVNGREIAQQDLSELPLTMASLVSAASDSAPLLAGDIIGLGPLAQRDEPVFLESGDEVVVSIERLGMLATRVI
ncbi:MAG TPA: fumarylacetoacetate hydrolase family protein [Fimbriimonadaceae bacterium]|nr:fumarylacetoacetate hydrolase family protein [Fimbriimonadaceae bacterium]